MGFVARELTSMSSPPTLRWYVNCLLALMLHYVCHHFALACDSAPHSLCA